MRRLLPLLIALSLGGAAPAIAQTANQSRSGVPDAKPPPLEIIDDSLQPQVTVRKRQGETVEEYRLNGRLYKIRITPDGGVPYILVDQKGDGSFVPFDGPGHPGISVPMWVIGTF